MFWAASPVAGRFATPDPRGLYAERSIKPTFANRVFRQAPLHSIRRMRPVWVLVADSLNVDRAVMRRGDFAESEECARHHET